MLALRILKPTFALMSPLSSMCKFLELIHTKILQAFRLPICLNLVLHHQTQKNVVSLKAGEVSTHSQNKRPLDTWYLHSNETYCSMMFDARLKKTVYCGCGVAAYWFTVAAIHWHPGSQFGHDVLSEWIASYLWGLDQRGAQTDTRQC